jgi:hypothetical protein
MWLYRHFINECETRHNEAGYSTRCAEEYRAIIDEIQTIDRFTPKLR